MAPRWSRAITVLIFLAGCGSVRAVPEDAPLTPIDAGDAPVDAIDAPIDAPDAPIDAPDAAPATVTPGQQLGASAGTLRGGGYQLDVQIGASWSQTPAIGGAHALRGSAPVLD